MVDQRKCDVLIIGAGPGGYVAAIRAAQQGLDTVVVDPQPPGGTCLNVGCIPSKALIHAADEFARLTDPNIHHQLGIHTSQASIDLSATYDWMQGIVERLNQGVDHLLSKAGVTRLQGVAHIKDGKHCAVALTGSNDTVDVHCKHLVIATGSTPVELPDLAFGDDVMSSTDALSQKRIPKTLAVVGAGYIGMELGTAFAKLGTQVTVVEATDRLLPQYDQELTRQVSRRAEQLGIKFLLNSKAMGYARDTQTLTVLTDDITQSIVTEKVLVTVGRIANIHSFGLHSLDLDLQAGCIKVDSQCRTSMTGVYAIGDVTGEPMLAHRAMAQGHIAADVIAGRANAFDNVCIPAICFSDPEIVTAGLGTVEAQQQDYETITTVFPLSANGRAMTLQAEHGFVRIIARKDNHMIVGIQATGHNVAELSSTFALALEMHARLEDLADTIHAHPTLGEGIQEAAMGGLGVPLHI